MKKVATRNPKQAIQQLTQAIFLLVRSLALRRLEENRSEDRALGYHVTRMLSLLTELHVCVNHKQIILDRFACNPLQSSKFTDPPIAEGLHELTDTIGSWPFLDQIYFLRVQESLRQLRCFYITAEPIVAEAAPIPLTREVPNAERKGAPEPPAASQPPLILKQSAARKRQGKIRVGSKIYYRKF